MRLIWKEISLTELFLIEKYCKGIPTDVYNLPSDYQIALSNYNMPLSNFKFYLRRKSIFNLFEGFRRRNTIELERK